MKKVLFALSALAMLHSSCKSDKPDATKEASADAVRLASKINNSDLVRLPVTADTPLDPSDAPKMEFEETTFDFGKIKEGDVKEHVFNFKNTGKGPLIISSARGSCGCTIPEYPKEPIAPGASSTIKVKFNSAGKEGPQDKKVYITANTYPTNNEIHITGEVEPNPDKKKSEVETE